MSNEHILIVEDTALVMVLLRSRLTADGYEVTGAGKVAEALHAMRTRMPDLVVLDLTLFDDDPTGLTDGFAVLSLLRLRYPEADTAVIIYSANTKPAVETRAKAMGVFAVIDKNDGVVPLLTAIRAALDERKARQAALPAPPAPPAPPVLSPLSSLKLVTS